MPECYNRWASDSSPTVIAISYRREDSTGITGRVYDRLQSEFGKANVFMDFDSIPYGVDFREHIAKTLDRAKVVLVVMGPEWAGQKSRKVRRIDDPADFVRIEVATALQRQIPIIPVLVNNARMPTAENLPKDIAELAFRNGLVLDSGIDFHHHTDRLITGIRAAAGETGKKPTKAASDPAIVRRRKLIFGTAAGGMFLAALIVATISLIVRAAKTGNSSAPVAALAASPSATSSSGSPAAVDDGILQIIGDFHGQTLDFVDSKKQHHSVSAAGRISNLAIGYGTMVVVAGVREESVFIKPHQVVSWTYKEALPHANPSASASSTAYAKRVPSAAQSSPVNGKLFAGTWRGPVHEEVRNAAGALVDSSDSTGEVVIDQTETKWEGLTGGSAFVRDRTLKYNGIVTSGGTKQQVHATLIVHEDGVTATYTKSLKPVGGSGSQRFMKGPLRKVQ